MRPFVRMQNQDSMCFDCYLYDSFWCFFNNELVCLACICCGRFTDCIDLILLIIQLKRCIIDYASRYEWNTCELNRCNWNVTRWVSCKIYKLPHSYSALHDPDMLWIKARLISQAVNDLREEAIGFAIHWDNEWMCKYIFILIHSPLCSWPWTDREMLKCSEWYALGIEAVIVGFSLQKCSKRDTFLLRGTRSSVLCLHK